MMIANLLAFRATHVPGYLPIADATTDSVEAWTANLDTPGPSVSGADRQRRCRVVEIGHGCVTNEVDCTECTRALVRAIAADLDTAFR